MMCDEAYLNADGTILCELNDKPCKVFVVEQRHSESCCDVFVDRQRSDKSEMSSEAKITHEGYG